MYVYMYISVQLNLSEAREQLRERERAVAAGSQALERCACASPTPRAASIRPSAQRPAGHPSAAALWCDCGSVMHKAAATLKERRPFRA